LGICGTRPLPPALAQRWRGVWRAVTRPWAATLLFTAVMLVWHIPTLYDATLTTEPIHIFEHLTFIAVGVVFWWPIVDPVKRAGENPVGPFAKIAMLVASGIPPTVLGLIFSISPRTFYEYYARAPRLWGLSTQADQQLAGVAMFGIGNLIYFAAISIIFVRLFGDAMLDEAEVARSQAGGRLP
ncbi:MAG TPA: cytochrome c oxidase assembly protein, partial [Candidatus Sulfotelmatobacter sp.]|nr:cytochrome c oxidase assembly protein [Candidatus Sulfotelmatobacter sp.]